MRCWAPARPCRSCSTSCRAIADTEASVLITGESGTGKELVARAIHRQSRRQDKPFVAVNCAALPDALLESELFGHAKGAFTDARAARKGLFLEAESGTLFLDEIGDFPLPTQAKLLRALEEQKLRPVGGDRELPFDVRILSATNRDLETAVEEGRFREDLYFRINVIQVEVPPLRARGGDILLLAQHFVHVFAARSGKQVTGISRCRRRETDELLLARQRPRIAKRHRAGRGADALRESGGRRSAREDPRLPEFPDGHRPATIRPTCCRWRTSNAATSCTCWQRWATTRPPPPACSASTARRSTASCSSSALTRSAGHSSVPIP